MTSEKDDRKSITFRNGDAGNRASNNSVNEFVDERAFFEADRYFGEYSASRAFLRQDEKRKIGNKIADTISHYRRRKLMQKLSLAASLIFIVGTLVFLQVNNRTQLKDYLANIPTVDESVSTRLFLSGEREVIIDSRESKIEYAEAGDEVRIDSDQSVEQDLVETEAAPNTVVVPYGKRTMICLSDNSKVWLNSGSRLIYPARFDSDKREVYLEGEAIFEVSHDPEHPFHVLTRDVEVKVLGTVFNLTAYPDELVTQTVLEHGAVELKFQGESMWAKSKTKMVPGSLAVYDPQKKTVEQTRVDPKYYTSWKDGYLAVESQKLGEILKKVARYYNASIRISDRALEQEMFSGNLDLQQSVDQVIEVIAEFIRFKVERMNNEIVISKI